MKKLYHYPVMVLLSIMAILLLIVFEICFFITQVLFKSEIYSDVLKDKDISGIIYSDLETYYTQYSAPTGIPAEVFTDPLDEDELHDAAYTLLIDSVEYLSNKNADMPKVTYDYTALEESITSYIETYSEENDIEKDDEYYALIENTISTAEAQIEDRLDVMMLYSVATSTYASTVHKYSGYVSIAMVCSLVLLIAIWFVMVYVNRHHPRDYTYWAGTIFFCTSLLFLVPCRYLDKVGYFNRFIIKTSYVYSTVTGLLNEVLDRIITAQTAVFIISILLIISTLVVHLLYKKYKKRKKLEEISV